MPLKLIAGVSKKVGLPGYSSVGAICHVELELESRLIAEAPEAFRAKVRAVYAQCAESVDEELARHQAPRQVAGSAAEMSANGHANSNGHASGNGQPPSRASGKARSRPSARQLVYVEELAGRVGMDAAQIEGLCQRLFKKPLQEISGGEAGGLIRALQEMREGWLGQKAVSHPDGV